MQRLSIEICQYNQIFGLKLSFLQIFYKRNKTRKKFEYVYEFMSIIVNESFIQIIQNVKKAHETNKFL